MNFETLNKQRKFILIASAAGVVSMFLPWISLGFLGSINGLHDWGILIFIAFIISGVIAFIGDQTKQLDTTKWFIALVAGGLAALLTLIFVLRVIADIAPGFGTWIALLSAAAILYGAWSFKKPSDNIKGGFDSLKKDIGNSQTTTTNS